MGTARCRSNVGGRLTGRVGRLHPRRAQHPERRCAGVRRADNDLFGDAAEARHPAPEQRRRHVHRPVPRPARRRAEPGLRRRRDVCLLQQPDLQHLLGRDPHAAGGADTGQSYRAQMDYAGDRYGLQLERLVVDEQFRPEVGYRPPRRHPPSVRPGQVQPAAAGEQDRPQVVLDRVDGLHRERRRAGSRPATATASSPSSSTTAIGFTSATTTSTSSFPRRFASPRASSCRSAATTTPPSSVGYNLGQQRRASGERLVRARHASTTATRRRSASAAAG